MTSFLLIMTSTLLMRTQHTNLSPQPKRNLHYLSAFQISEQIFFRFQIKILFEPKSFCTQELQILNCQNMNYISTLQKHFTTVRECKSTSTEHKTVCKKCTYNAEYGMQKYFKIREKCRTSCQLNSIHKRKLQINNDSS